MVFHTKLMPIQILDETIQLTIQCSQFQINEKLYKIAAIVYDKSPKLQTAVRYASKVGYKGSRLVHSTWSAATIAAETSLACTIESIKQCHGMNQPAQKRQDTMHLINTDCGDARSLLHGIALKQRNEQLVKRHQQCKVQRSISSS
jgi:hypothetical protein